MSDTREQAQSAPTTADESEIKTLLNQIIDGAWNLEYTRGTNAHLDDIFSAAKKLKALLLSSRESAPVASTMMSKEEIAALAEIRRVSTSLDENERRVSDWEVGFMLKLIDRLRNRESLPSLVPTEMVEFIEQAKFIRWFFFDVYKGRNRAHPDFAPEYRCDCCLCKLDKAGAKLDAASVTLTNESSSEKKPETLMDVNERIFGPNVEITQEDADLLGCESEGEAKPLDLSHINRELLEAYVKALQLNEKNMRRTIDDFRKERNELKAQVERLEGALKDLNEYILPIEAEEIIFKAVGPKPEETK